MSIAQNTALWVSRVAKSAASERGVLLAGVGLILGFMLIIVLFARTEWQRVLNEVEVTSLTVSRVLAEHSDRLLETADLARIQVAEIVGDDDQFTFERGHFEQLARLARATPHITSIWVGDADGNAVLTSREFPAPSLNAVDREYFTAVRDDADALFIGTLTDNRYLDEVLINTSRRLPAEDGSFRGFVQVSLSPKHFRDTFRQVQLSYQTSLWLLGPDGQALMREPFVPSETMAEAAPRPSLGAGEASGHFIASSGIDGSQARFFYSRSPQYGSYVLVRVDEAELAALWRNRVLPIMLFGGLFIAALLAILVFIRREQLSGLRYTATLEQDVRDRTAELNRAVEERELILQELRHRVRNAFATIQALTGHMLRSSNNLETLKRTFPDRLAALAATQVLLVDSEDRERAPLEDLVWAEIAPYRSKGDSQVIVEGPEVQLPANKITAVGLALHELVTNAVKYGALSVPEGRLVVRWGHDADGTLVLNWIEKDGPTVAEPVQRGFGSEVLERSAKLFSGQIELNFDPNGLRAELRLPAG